MLSSSHASESFCSSDTDLVDELQQSSQCTGTTPEVEEETDMCYSSLSTSENETTGRGSECDGHQKQPTNTTKKPRKRLHVYRCSYPSCEKEFPRKSRLERHQRKHLNEKPFICTIGDCEKSFTCKFYLNKHMKRPHGKTTTCKKEKKRNQCDECGKTFKHKFDLKTHAAVHGGEKPFKCDICAETFALRARLKKHMKRHDGYPCQRDECDFVGDSWSTLQKHIFVKHRKLHRCEFCDREFHSTHKLRAHSVVHQDKKKYLCPYDGCDRIYLRQFNLRAHIKAVHSNETFKCEQAGCDHEVHYKASHIRHMKTHQKKSMNGGSKINLGKTKSMAAVLSQFEITKEENYRIVRGEMLEDCEANEA